ncbi:MAG: hypothetical protein HUU15_14665, partial [Candidatus Brocadiae bacterium]|nr:hypothetical protein [Candidatus Brocadiia bacterium]
MGDPSAGPTPDDRLTQMVQAAVSASLARRSAILKPREIQELTADARAQLDDLILRRDADLQRLALLERAREKLQEEIVGIQSHLAGHELRLDEGRRGSVRVEQRLAGMEREAEPLRAELARKQAEAEDAEVRAKTAADDVEKLRAEAVTLPQGAPSRGELEARARLLQA